MQRRTRAWMVSVTMALGLAAGIAIPMRAALADPPGTGFVYQGQIKKNGLLLAGPTDLRFTLFDAAAGGVQVGDVLAVDALDIADGRFNVELDFGAGIFDGQARWVQVEIRSPAGSGAYSILNGRQAIKPTPYALYALNAGPGAQGAEGPPGPQGPAGPMGPSGPQGETGPQGVQGDPGPAGPQGLQGDVGPTGPMGPAGPTGAPGLGLVNWRGAWDVLTPYAFNDVVYVDGSSYRSIADPNLGNDPALSPNEWEFIAMRGADGAAGAQGPQGDMGPAGPQGIPGDSGPAGPQGPQGDVGPVGPQGVPGDIGPAGPQGPQGDAGPIGPQGVPGDIGPAGPQGPQGDAGPVGPQGIPGLGLVNWRGAWDGLTTYAANDVVFAAGSSYRSLADSNLANDPTLSPAAWELVAAQGSPGAQGVQGDPGPAGPQGDIGPAGPQGVPGDIGPAGPAGPQGDIGPAGPQGPQGEIGPAGAQGLQGPSGPAGPEGPQGVMGPAGPQGDVGPAGPQGPEGPQGVQGVQGPAGPAGPQGIPGLGLVNWRGVWDGLTIYAANDVVFAAGSSYRSLADANTANDPASSPAAWELIASRGAQGPQGAAGPSGPQGPTGPVGPQGREGPEGKEGRPGAAGLQGPAGPSGPSGPQGAAGPAGATGPAGPQGDAGPQGLTGPAGPMGATGPAGPQGDVGPAGPQGPQGAQGPQGLQGPQGVQGPQGDVGPQGPAGASPWSLSGSNTYYTQGRVGIGTPNPLDSLHIISSGNNAILAQNSNAGGNALYAWNSALTGLSFGIRGLSSSTTGVGAYGFSPNIGLQGESSGAAGIAVLGTNSSPTGNAYGVQGLSGSATGTGVYGNGNLNGVWAETSNAAGRAVFANQSSGTGANYGVFAQASSANGTGVLGVAPLVGVQGNTGSATGKAVVAQASSSTGASFGLFAAVASDQGTALYGKVTNNTNNGASRFALFADAPVVTNSWAGWFQGNVNITGSIFAASKSFRIDHPLDPENKYLNHVSVESPEMKTLHDGSVVLDGAGEAWVLLPDYFEAMNKDFRYQLTCVGGYAPVYVAERIHANRFKIAGGSPGLEISWTVTGVRTDPWAQKNRIPVEELKSPEDRGKYLAPDAYGKPESRRLAPQPVVPAVPEPVRVPSPVAPREESPR